MMTANSQSVLFEGEYLSLYSMNQRILFLEEKLYLDLDEAT